MCVPAEKCYMRNVSAVLGGSTCEGQEEGDAQTIAGWGHGGSRRSPPLLSPASSGDAQCSHHLQQGTPACCMRLEMHIGSSCPVTNKA